ncbi:hypothetical protein KP509_25G025300 [Ceratopteris richardii]|uniref:Uncharacterized protein n=1 Tax=Ceratopteris richardii TaxID=49495 RepID=A0A8T2RRJ2_CERRI|nr:hypothetical protein KP509_25G025300 [Ceratopteris richardii]
MCPSGLALAVDPDFKVFASSYPFVLQKLLTDISGPFKNILSTLILNKKKQFRWDRLASFITIAQQHSQKKLALETGKEPSITYNADGKVVNLKMIQLLANLLLSEKGTVFRQLILEADTCDLAHMFNSNKAAPLRRNLATAMANVFYEAGKTSLRKHTGISIQEPVLLDSQNKHKDLISSTDKPFLDDFKALTNCSDSFDISILENRHMQYLFQTMATRLRRHPLLLAHTGWTSFSILTYSLALAAHRLVVAICFKLLSERQISPLPLAATC